MARRNGRIGLVLAAVSVFGSMGAAWAEPSPGQYDSLVLAMSYENDFCAANPSKVECQNGAGAIGMALHGLWPNVSSDYNNSYQYCTTVDRSIFAPGKDWCAPTDLDVRSQMSQDTQNSLLQVMPGVYSCLYNHEWYAHGTCSGVDVNRYFQGAAQLAHRFQGLSNFHVTLSRAVGASVSKAQLMQALVADLGTAAADAILIVCRRDKMEPSRFYFSEVEITLRPDTFMAFPAASSFGHNKPAVDSTGGLMRNSGGCPPDGILVTP